LDTLYCAIYGSKKGKVWMVKGVIEYLAEKMKKMKKMKNIRAGMRLQVSARISRGAWGHPKAGCSKKEIASRNDTSPRKQAKSGRKLRI